MFSRAAGSPPLVLTGRRFPTPDLTNRDCCCPKLEVWVLAGKLESVSKKRSITKLLVEKLSYRSIDYDF